VAILDHPFGRKAQDLSHDIVRRGQPTLHSYSLRELRLNVTRELGRGVVDHRRSTPHERCCEGAPLPQVVVVRLGDGGTEALLKVRLERLHLLAFALQAVVVREVEL